METVTAFLQAHGTAIMTGLFFLSEGLAQIPAVQANSLFQLIFGFLQKNQPKP